MNGRTTTTPGWNWLMCTRRRQKTYESQSCHSILARRWHSLQKPLASCGFALFDSSLWLYLFLMRVMALWPLKNVVVRGWCIVYVLNNTSWTIRSVRGCLPLDDSCTALSLQEVQQTHVYWVRADFASPVYYLQSHCTFICSKILPVFPAFGPVTKMTYICS